MDVHNSFTFSCTLKRNFIEVIILECLIPSEEFRGGKFEYNALFSR